MLLDPSCVPEQANLVSQSSAHPFPSCPAPLPSSGTTRCLQRRCGPSSAGYHGGETSTATALHGLGKLKCSRLLKGPFNSLSASTPPLDLPGMQDTGTFITPLQAFRGTDHFCACSTPHRELSALLGHQAYVPLATRTLPRHQDSQRPALAPKSQA